MPHSNANTALNPFNMLHFSVKNFLKHMFNKSVVLEYQKYLSNFICFINKKKSKKNRSYVIDHSFRSIYDLISVIEKDLTNQEVESIYQREIICFDFLILTFRFDWDQ